MAIIQSQLGWEIGCHWLPSCVLHPLRQHAGDFSHEAFEAIASAVGVVAPVQQNLQNQLAEGSHGIPTKVWVKTRETPYTKSETPGLFGTDMMGHRVPRFCYIPELETLNISRQGAKERFRRFCTKCRKRCRSRTMFPSCSTNQCQVPWTSTLRCEDSPPKIFGMDVTIVSCKKNGRKFLRELLPSGNFT